MIIILRLLAVISDNGKNDNTNDRNNDNDNNNDGNNHMNDNGVTTTTTCNDINKYKKR